MASCLHEDLGRSGVQDARGDREATSSSPSEYADCRDLIETSLATPSAIWHLDCEYSSLRCRAVADPPTVRFSTTGAKDMVSRTKERARDLLSVPGLPALVTQSTCWLRSAAASDNLAQHIHAAPRLCASLRLLCQSPRALTSSVHAACTKPAAQSPGDAQT